jgi:hypothetical protein
VPRTPEPLRCRRVHITWLAQSELKPAFQTGPCALSPPKGLEDQLLAEVVRHERSDLEEARDGLVVAIAADKRALQVGAAAGRRGRACGGLYLRNGRLQSKHPISICLASPRTFVSPFHPHVQQTLCPHLRRSPLHPVFLVCSSLPGNLQPQTQELEDRTLKLLREAEGNILDDEALIATLNNARATSATVAVRAAAGRGV